MKTIISVLVVGIVFLSCSQNEEEAAPVITEEETVAQVASSLTLDFGLFASDLTGLAESLEAGRVDGGRTEKCGQESDTTVTRFYEDSNISFDFSNVYEFLLVCDGLIPSILNVDFTASGNYSGQIFSSLGVSDGELEITGFGNSDDYTLNGTIVRNYNLSKLDDADFDFNTAGVILVRDVAIDKTFQVIQSGVANYSVEGTRNNGDSFQFTANVEFLGGGEARVEINNTTDFNVNLVTGQFEKTD